MSSWSSQADRALSARFQVRHSSVSRLRGSRPGSGGSAGNGSMCGQGSSSTSPSGATTPVSAPIVCHASIWMWSDSPMRRNMRCFLTMSPNFVATSVATAMISSALEPGNSATPFGT